MSTQSEPIHVGDEVRHVPTGREMRVEEFLGERYVYNIVCGWAVGTRRFTEMFRLNQIARVVKPPAAG